MAVSADRRCELILQQAHVVVVDVHVGEHLAQHSVENLAGLQHVVHALRALTLDDVLLHLRVFAVDMLRNRLVNAHRQDEFAVVWRGLNLVFHVGTLLEELARVEIGRLYVVQRERNLLVLVVLIVVVVLEMAALLRGDDTLHELHRRIVLARIVFAFLLDDHFAEVVCVFLQHNLKVRRSLRTHLYGLRLKTYRTERKLPAIMARNLELSVQIARLCHMMSLIDGACQWYRITIGIINFTSNLSFDRNDQS